MTFDPLEHSTAQVDLAALAKLGATFFPRGVAAIEVGSWVGGTAKVLANHFSRVYCIDTWEGTPSDRIGEVAQRHGQRKVLDTFCANMGPLLFGTVFPIVGRSIEWAARWPGQVDLVFLDADHEYHAIRDDIAAWRPIVREGGILCGHDFGAFAGVTRAVVEGVPGYQVEGSVWWANV